MATFMVKAQRYKYPNIECKHTHQMTKPNCTYMLCRHDLYKTKVLCAVQFKSKMGVGITLFSPCKLLWDICPSGWSTAQRSSRPGGRGSFQKGRGSPHGRCSPHRPAPPSSAPASRGAAQPHTEVHTSLAHYTAPVMTHTYIYINVRCKAQKYRVTHADINTH